MSLKHSLNFAYGLMVNSDSTLTSPHKEADSPLPFFAPFLAIQ